MPKEKLVLDKKTFDLVCDLPLFAGVEEQDRDWLLSNAETLEIAAGEVLMREGDPGGSLYIVLDGEVEITKRSGDQDVLIAMRGTGEVIGEMSLLDQSPRSATVRATRPSRLLLIKQEPFQQLLSTSPSATLAILHTVTSRLRHTQAMLQQNEKMAALGTLSAGLAHELNNPAAAARRSSAQLKDTLDDWQRLNDELLALKLDERQLQVIANLREEMVRRAAKPLALSPLARSDREGELQEWLEARGVNEAWEIAPLLVSFGWDTRSVRELGNSFHDDQLTKLMCWLGQGCNVYALLNEVYTSSERISEIVKAVKSYAYLDQAPVQEIDVHEGLENTLIILKHKLKQGIRVTRDYAADLPRIQAYGSELNQVWTNLIDNAIDAMNGEGELTLRTYRKDNSVVVEIADNGPGIPPEIQSRIYEPFFTTKPPGIGTGLGLHITYNIIQKHHGRIRVNSQPGATVFQISLPLQLRKQ